MRSKRLLFAILLAAATLAGYNFKPQAADQDRLAWVNQTLAQVYDQSTDPKLKKVELIVTADYFIRLRKTYPREMQEYYSFNLHQFNDLDYFGNTSTGTLQLKTMADDIIVQTYNDHRGDIDSMATTLDIPVKNMEPETLDSLRDALNYFKAKGL